VQEFGNEATADVATAKVNALLAGHCGVAWGVDV
jgi:hypothetical protein